MQKSARVLGQEYGLTAAEMNFLLREEGYLEGSPGMYGVTDKGIQFADEQFHKRGTGGYAQYNPTWETRTWDEKITSELDLSSERKQELRDAIRAAKQAALASTGSAAVAESVSDHGSDDSEVDWLSIAVGVVLTAVTIYGIKKVAPHLKALWKDKAAPRFANRKNRETGEPAVANNEIGEDPAGEESDP
jgi:hypothetical protein